jgi:hypothetical protein
MRFLATLRANIAAALLGLLAAILLAISVYQTVALHGFLWIEGANDKIDRLTIDNNELRFAAKEAERKNLAEVARRESEQEQINAEVVSDLERDLARLRDELRAEAAKGSAGQPGLPKASASPQGTPEATGLCLSPSEHVRAAQNELYHDKLIDWAYRIEEWWKKLER